MGFEPMTSAIPVYSAPVSQRSWVQIPYRPELVMFMNESDLRSDVHYLGSNENKA